MVANLLFILVLRVNDDIGNKTSENVFEKLWGEVERCPVVS